MNVTCPHFLDLLLESLDDPLGPRDQEEFDGHLAACPGCAATLREHVMLRAALQDLDAEPVGGLPPLPEGLVTCWVAAMRSAVTHKTDGHGEESARTA